MDPAEQSRFDELYQRHLRLLKLQGKSHKTIDVYAREINELARQRLEVELWKVDYATAAIALDFMNKAGQ